MKFDVEKFKRYIEQHGGEIQPVTSEYELVRFRGSQIGVIYKSGKCSGVYATQARKDYKAGRDWSGRPTKASKARRNGSKKTQLLLRDGDECFYCLQEMRLDEMSVEHLIPTSAKGPHILQNMVLAHQKCNSDMGSKTLIEKLKIRESNLKKSYENQ